MYECVYVCVCLLVSFDLCLFLSSLVGLCQCLEVAICA